LNAAADLLIQLRAAGIVVTVDGAEIRCRAPKGVLTPELVHRLKEHKPDVLVLLIAEDQEIAWRVESISEGLLGAGSERMPGVCSWCGSAMPVQPSPKCVLCAIAAAELVQCRLDSAGHMTYPISDSDVAPRDSERRSGLRDMSSKRKEAA
jgi:TubC N-terminal docking domain